MIRNDFYRKDSRAAPVTSTAGWFDLANRKLVLPARQSVAILARDRA